MNPEIELQVMQSHVSELRQAAAHHRQVREAEKANKAARRSRSVFGMLRSS